MSFVICDFDFSWDPLPFQIPTDKKVQGHCNGALTLISCFYVPLKSVIITGNAHQYTPLYKVRI